jgi:nucleoid DNA-binding protein
MAMSLKLSKTKAYNPSTKKQGFRTTVKSNGKADMESLIASASNNTTMHKGEMQLAFTLMLDAIKEALVSGKTVELKGIGNIGFTCSGAWTETAEEQKAVEHKIGVAFYPSQEVHAAVATAQTSWTKDGEGNEPAAPGTGGTEQKPGGGLDG